MKRPLMFIYLSMVLAPSIMQACATCIGTVEPDSPTFFSDELYQIEQTKTENSENNTFIIEEK